MVDIHNHFLWGLDDGARSIEESLAMLKAASDSGTTDVVATPHANARYAYQPDLVEQKVQELSQRTNNQPKIHRACEFHLSFDNIDHLLEWPFPYTVNGKQYLLVECPDSQIGSYTDSVFQRLIDAGLIPIIAHPERNPAIRNQPQRLKSWVDLGCLVQITALSIMGGFGASAKGASMRLLEQGLVHIVASDAHDPVRRSPRLDEAYNMIQSRYDETTAEILFTHNPKAVIEGLALAGGRQVSGGPAPAKWYQFWKSL